MEEDLKKLGVAENIEFDRAMYDKYAPMISRLARDYSDKIIDDGSNNIAHTYHDKYCDAYMLYQDLVQEGWIGVHQACENYIPDMGASFFTYAYSRAKRKMQYYLQYRNSVVHVPIAHKETYGLEMVDVIDAGIKDLPSEKYPLVMQALQEIDPYYAEMVVLKHVHGLSVSAMSREFGVPRETIDDGLLIGMALLREALGVWR